MWRRSVPRLDSFVGVALLYLSLLNTCTQGKVQGCPTPAATQIYCQCQFCEELGYDIAQWVYHMAVCSIMCEQGRNVTTEESCERTAYYVWHNGLLWHRTDHLHPYGMPALPSLLFLWYACTALFIVLIFCFDIMCNTKVACFSFWICIKLFASLSFRLSFCLSLTFCCLLMAFLLHCLLCCFVEMIMKWYLDGVGEYSHITGASVTGPSSCW